MGTLGDQYGKKQAMLPRYKNKQFLTMPAKHGRCKEALFGGAFPWLSDGDKYVDKTQYLKTQPQESRKKGFHSSDAMRRDEFMNHIRTEQWRWALGREADFRKRHESSAIAAAHAQTMPRPPPLPPLGQRDAAYHTPQ